MFFSRAPKIIKEELGVVFVDSSFICSIVSVNNRFMTSTHGLGQVTAHAIYFDQRQNTLCVLISSKEIPNYVAYHNIMEDLEYFELEGQKYPIIGLGFTMVTPVTFKDIQGELDEQNDSYWEDPEDSGGYCNESDE